MRSDMFKWYGPRHTLCILANIFLSKTGRETSMCGGLSHISNGGPGPQPSLNGNRTGGPLVRRPMLNPLSYTSQGY